MWPRRELLDLLRIEHPIIQAPMAGSATPELAAAVSNAGGLGSLGCGTQPPEAVKDAALALRAATNRAYNLNFFAHRQEATPPEVEAAAREKVNAFARSRGLDDVTEPLAAPFPPFGPEMLELLLELRPPVVSFHFGPPAPEAIDALKARGTVLLCSATTVDEARRLEDAGFDAVIAQGWEAGGHRGSFDIGFEDAGVGTLALVPQIADAVSVPVIAAGGIADGRGIAAAFALGASGVQLGTAFLSCPESAASALHRTMLRESRAEETCLTRAFSGRPARARATAYMAEMARKRGALPAFPAMYSLARPLLEKGMAENDPELLFLLYGQAAPLSRELPAAELLDTLVEEAQAALRGLAGR